MEVLIQWLQGNWFFLTLLGGAAGLILRVDRRVQKLVRDVERQEHKRIEGTERNELLLAGVLATLDGMHEQGLNGPVTKARERIELYMQKQAAK